MTDNSSQSTLCSIIFSIVQRRKQCPQNMKLSYVSKVTQPENGCLWIQVLSLQLDTPDRFSHLEEESNAPSVLRKFTI